MSERIEELLAVLDLPEREQVEWVETHCEMKGHLSDESTDELSIWVITESLADLAFRLRDEVSKTQCWREAKYIVGDKAFGGYHEYRQDHEIAWDEEAQPIHWIVASLIAKELAK